ncbi:HMA2 domain-containing protein [Scytonema sp. PCC 10023]|uniref:HMA2 domain-containing protein n=1 Tax=Scytonema sp. PCC 10023 TaxID=1680591 RepID=UPI0039C6AF98
MTKTLSSRERLSPREQKLVDLISDHQQDHQQSDESSETTSKSVAQSVAQSTMQPPVGGLHIVHATAGRVRIRATDGSHNSILETISQNLRKQDGVREVSVNDQTGSLVVNFDEKKLSLPQMLERLQQFDIHQLPASPQAESKQDPFAAWKSAEFWKEQGISFIPMFTGLAVTGGLGISGLPSIPVYMITANATRRVIDSLKPQVAASQIKKNSQKASEKKLNKTDQPSSSKVQQTFPIKTEKSTNVVDKVNDVKAQPGKIAYSVVHAIPGRIRFNVPRVARDRAYARRLERLLKTDSKVTSVRMNCDAASIAIAHKAGEIPVSYWVGLMELADKTIPETTPVKTTPVNTTTEQPLPPNQLVEPAGSTTAEQQPIETASIWSDFKTPALSTALSFLANFPLDSVPDSGTLEDKNGWFNIAINTALK